MAKKGLSRKEREAKLKKRLALGGMIFLVLVVAAIVVGIIAFSSAERKEKISYELLRETLLEDYEKEPWDGGSADSVKEKKGEMWAIFEALMRIEDDGMENGSKGIEYDSRAGDTICLDHSEIKDDALAASLERMFEDYAKRKNMRFDTGSLAELKEKGKIDETYSNRYTNGCVFQILSAGWQEENELYKVKFFIYYTNMYGKGASVFVARKDYFEKHREEYFDKWKPISDDGCWVAYIAETMVS